MRAAQEGRKADTPELLLARLHQTLTDVLVAVGHLDLPESGRKIVDRIRAEAKAVLVSKLLFDTAAIAVTGLQGVGKSTLVSRFYDLPEDLLPISLGRDEKIPVLFLEHSSELQLGGIRIGGPELTSELTFSEEEFKRAAIDPPDDLALLTVRTPHRLFGDHTQGLVMLPGIESSVGPHADSRPSGWEGLVHHALLSAARCVFVVTPTLLADESNRATLERVRDRFEGMTPIVVITNTDRFQQGMDEYRDTAARLAGVPVDQVILSGATEELKASSKASILKALSESTGTRASFRTLQLTELAALSRERLADALTDLKYEINDSLIEVKTDKHRHVDEVLDCFNDAVEDFRDRLENAIDEGLQSHSRDVIDTLEEHILSESWIKKFGKLFLSSSLEERRELEKMLQDVWTENGEGLQHVVAATTQECAELQLKPYTSRKKEPPEGNRTMALLEDKEELSGLHWVMSADAPQDLVHPTKFQGALQKSPPVIALLGTAFQDIGTVKDLSAAHPEWLPSSGDVEAIFRDVENAGDTKKRVVATLAAAALGADVAADGSVDLIPAIAGKLGFEISSMAASVIAGAAVLYAVASIGVATRNQIVKSDLQRADAARLAVNSMREATVEGTLGRYDRLVDLFRTHLAFRLNRAHGFDEQWSRAQHAQLMVSRAQQARRHLVAALEPRFVSSVA